ncbi:MAG: glutamate ligase domain-containing protein, partial [Oscillospiraceae bacterium]
ANPDSVKAAVKTLCTTTKNCNKIFVFADMNELGSISGMAHRDIGEVMAKMNVDFLLCIGNKSKLTVQAAQEAGINMAMWFDTKADLIKKLEKITQPGSVVWIKGSRNMKLEEVANEIILK